MLIVKVGSGESVDKAIKRFKKKFEKVGVLKEIRERQAFIKKSVRKREQQMKAEYRQKLLQENS